MSFALTLGAALAFCAAAVLALGLAAELERRFSRRMVPALYLLNLLVCSLFPLLAGRGLFMSTGVYEPGGPGKWLVRLAIAATLAICVARLLGGAFSGENRRAGGAALLAAFGVYFLASVVLSSAFGADAQFQHEHYYVPFLFAAVYASRTHDPELAVRFAKVGFFVFLAASWAVAAVAPELAIQANYHGSWIPGVTHRFWGLDNSPNHMGPAALAFLLLALHQPFERRALQWLGMVLGVAALLATQSKTAWLAAALAVPLLLVLRSRAWSAAALSLAGLGAALAGALLVLPLLGVSLEGLVNARQMHSALTFSGREGIWALAVQEWMRNPLFGHGLSLWDSAYRQAIGMDWAVSAHNQFLQVLSVSGAVGLIGLLAYLGALALHAIRARHASQGLSLALLVLILVQCVTETPVTIDSPLNAGFATQLLLFQLALAYGSRRARRRAAVPGRPAARVRVAPA